MKHFLIIAGIALLLSGCGQKIKPEDSDISPLTKSASRSSEAAQVKDATISRTTFSFSPSEVIFLKSDASQKVIVRTTPQYEPVSTFEVQLLYDPKKITISGISPHDGILSIEASADSEQGIIHFIGTSTEGIYGKDVPLFSFDVDPATPDTKGESVVRFDSSSTHALLSDINNTDTVDTENLPFLVFSLL